MFRHIRSKLIAAFAVPLAILVAAAGLEAASSLRQIHTIDQQTALASASVGPGGLVQDLQTEREFAVLDIVSHAVNLPAPLQGIGPARAGMNGSTGQYEAATDVAVATFRQKVQGAGPQAQADFSGPLAALSTLPAARHEWAGAAAGQTVAGYATVASRTYDAYTSVINAIIGATAQVPLQISDSTLRTGVEALYTSLDKTESQYQVLQDLMVASWSNAAGRQAALSEMYAAWGADRSLGQRLDAFAGGPYNAALASLTSGPVDAAISSSLAALRATGVPDVGALLQAFNQPGKGGAPSSGVQAGDAQIAAVVSAQASDLHQTALEKAIAFGAAALLAIVLGLGLAIALSRSISRPLVNLARHAEQLAEETLPNTVHAILEAGNRGERAPEPPGVPVQSKDEVGEMARALAAVNKTAIELATGQATLRKSLSEAFINLGRRNQNLVTRQLEYISEIEVKEGDPEALEELFRLDHLATRMRRNAESLLILAGSGPARQWSAAVPAMDVARAASAEVEDYKRLHLHHFDQAMVTGAVTTDLVHIMAELTENALTFSPPGSAVDIYGRFLEGGYVIVIVDSGIGMSPEDLAVANRRLSGEGSDADVPGRYLGHFVAGRLARRHGIQIGLQASHSGGLVARIKIPAALLEDPVPDLSAGAELGATEDDQSHGFGPVEGFAPSSQGPVGPATFNPHPVNQGPTGHLFPGQAPVSQRAADPAPFGPAPFGSAPFSEPAFGPSRPAEPALSRPAEPALAEPALAQPEARQPEARQPEARRPEAQQPPPARSPFDNAVLAAAAEAFGHEPAADAGDWYGRGVQAAGYGAPGAPPADSGDPTAAYHVSDGYGADTVLHPTTNSGPGHAGYESNRHENNGYESNGYEGNGYEGNGYASNGYGPKGYQPEDYGAPNLSASNLSSAAYETNGLAPYAEPAPEAEPWATPRPSPASPPSPLAQPSPVVPPSPALGRLFDQYSVPATDHSAPRPAEPPARDHSAPLAPPAGPVPTPDLGARAPLVSGRAPSVPAPPVPAPGPLAPSSASWDPVAHQGPMTGPSPTTAPVPPAAPATPRPSPSGNGAFTPPASSPAHVAAATPPAAGYEAPTYAQPGVGPAAQARSTAEGLRKLTRRVPGASLPQEDDSLRRATPTHTGNNRMALTGALSQYLSATNEGRSEKERNA